MKVINSKLAAIGLAAFVFVSCSDSTNDGGSSTPVTPGVLDATTIELTPSDAASLLSRVTNYKNSTANARKFFGTRAGDGKSFPSSTDFNLPVEKAASAINGKGNLEEGKTYVIQGKLNGAFKSIDMQGCNLNGATIFVHSGCTLTIDANANATIILGYKDSADKLHEGGTLVLGGNTIPANCKVITYFGEIKADGDITVAGELYANYRGQNGKGQDLQTGIGAVNKETVDNKTVLVPTQNITFAKKAYINGSIRAKKLTIASGAVVTTDANVLNSTEVDVAGALKVAGFLKTATLNVTGKLDASESTSAIKVTSVMKNSGYVNANYINVTDNKNTSDATLYLYENSIIDLANKSVMFINNLVTDNKSENQVRLNVANAVAVVKADKFTYEGTESKIKAFSTPEENATLLFQFNKSWHGDSEQIPSQADLDLGCSYYDYDQATNGSAVDLKDNENQQYGYELKVDADGITKKPKLDLIAAVDATNGRSATCIQPDGNYIYTSYHTHGNAKTEKGGGLEVTHIDGKQVKLDKAVMNDSLDINHLLVDNGKIYFAGSSYKEGALFGYTTVNGNDIGTKLTTYPLDKLNKNGNDANVVVKYMNNYVMSSTRGYEIFEPTTYNHSLVTTTKEAKGLAVSGNKLYSLIGDNGSTVTKGEVRYFENDAALANVNVIDAEAPEITPVDGKNTVAVDGNNVYVCCGANGLVRYTDGTENGTYSAPKTAITNVVKGYCNGVAVDDKYVYVACGGYGLVVLNKSDLTEVCHRKAYNSGYNANGDLDTTTVAANSANYVAVNGGYIYVAYGKSRVQVFKVTETGTSK